MFSMNSGCICMVLNVGDLLFMMMMMIMFVEYFTLSLFSSHRFRLKQCLCLYVPVVFVSVCIMPEIATVSVLLMLTYKHECNSKNKTFNSHRNCLKTRREPDKQ